MTDLDKMIVRYYNAELSILEKHDLIQLLIMERNDLYELIKMLKHGSDLRNKGQI